MDTDPFLIVMLSALEDELKAVINIYRQTTARYPDENLRSADLYGMLTYHMGWENGLANQPARGKRIRPLLVMLTCHSGGGKWQDALPAACAVELIHNFSLIHDDIQDESPLRHGRPTIWRRWGSAQAINAGDLMFALAMTSIVHPKHQDSPENAVQAENILTGACMQLTYGQSLDLAFEALDFIDESDYWGMVNGKTCALLSASMQLGGLFAGLTSSACEQLALFGQKFGQAFQARDDLLGIWGKLDQTGKSAESDLERRKKTLPVLYALKQNGQFANRWKKGLLSKEEIPVLAHILETEGAYDYTQQACTRLTTEALVALQKALPPNDGRKYIENIVSILLERNR